MEEPQQAAPGMAFSARAGLGRTHTESGVNKDSQEPRAREQEEGRPRRKAAQGSSALYPVQEVWLMDKIKPDCMTN